MPKWNVMHKTQMHVQTSKQSRNENPFFRFKQRFPTEHEPLANEEPMESESKLPESLEYEHEHAIKMKDIKTKEINHNNSGGNKKTRRGYGKKRKYKQNKGPLKLHFSLLGTNANGISNKLDSLRHALNTFQPSVLTLQETKLRKSGTLKLQGYQIFEQIRKGGMGGGLLTAVNENLTPVLISAGQEEDSEILTVHKA